MKYITFDKNDEALNWSTVYCNLDGNEGPEDIVKSITDYIYINKFVKEEHLNAGCPKIENDENLFILRDFYGSDRIWQVGNKYSDMTGCVVPHLYKVREIGILFD